LPSEEGAALVETALSFTILMSVLIGLIQVCLALYSFNSVSNAARRATRYAIVRGSACVSLPDCGVANSDIQTYVRNLGLPGINTANLTTSTTWYSVTMNTAVTPNTAVLTSCGTSPTGCNVPGNQVTVRVSYQFPLNVPFVSSSVLTLRSTSAMMISQ
jgi:Flp pilus assembly protein TadG